MKLEKKKKATDRNHRYTLRWIWEISGNEKRNIALLMLIQMLLAISSVFFAWFLRDVIDWAVKQEIVPFQKSVGRLVGVVVFQVMARAVKRFLDEYTKSGLENRFKERLFEVLLNGDYAQVTAVHSEEWMNRLTSDTVVVADGMTVILPDIAGMLVRLIGAMAAILVLVPGLGWILLPGGAVLLLVSWAFRKKSKLLHKQVQETDGKLRVMLSERLSGLLIVRSFAREEQTAAQARQKMEAHRTVRMKKNWFSNLCNTGFSAVMNGVYLAGALYCGTGILNGTMSYGSFSAVLQLIGQIQSPFANITGYLPKFYAMLASAERLMEAEAFEEISRDQLLEMEEANRFYGEEFAAIGLKNATFTYQPPVQEGDLKKMSMPVVLNRVNLEIRKGEYAAFTGHSGCGKSTVLKLLMSLYPLDEGSRYLICRDGTQKILDARYARLFAYVPQGNHLMSGSIREMVAFSDQDKIKEDAQIRRALEVACALEFVSELPDGMDTMLGERGQGLSEGQMQRIAIARAVFSGNPILVLDESTSALDEETERKLLENLRRMTDKTVLIVTHRMTVLEICDRRIVMNEEGIEVNDNGNEADRTGYDLSTELCALQNGTAAE